MKFLKLFLIDFGQHQKVVHDQPSVKWSSRKSNYMLLKVNKIHTFFFFRKSSWKRSLDNR